VKNKTAISPARGSLSQQRNSLSDADGNGGYAIGIDVGGSNLRVALADTQGNLLGKWSASTRETSSPEMVVEQIREGVNSLLESNSISPNSLIAVGAGAPGITQVDAGIVVATSYLKGWRNVPFRDHLESALHVPAVIENDTRLAAIGEQWKGVARGIRNFAFIAMGTGVAAGIVANGELVRGTNWTAGEIGYMYVPGASEEVAAPGAPGSLESTIGGEGVRQQWLRVCREAGMTDVPTVKATEIFEQANANNRLAQIVLDRTARALAYGVYNICLVLNCECVVLGGGVGMSPVLRDATQKILDQYVEPPACKLVISKLGEDAQLVGAIRLALEKAEAVPST
jgi:glucokinase